MTSEPPSPLSETDKLAATLAELEQERQRRLEAGKWSRGMRPVLMAVPQAGETLQAARQRALYGYLAEHPDAPKNLSAYEWMVVEIVDPEPVVELPGTLYAPDHGQAVDVTPPAFRPPMPMPPQPPTPEPLSYSNAGVPRVVLERELKRLKNFHDGDWGDPKDHPIRYPRGNRNGW